MKDKNKTSPQSLMNDLKKSKKIVDDQAKANRVSAINPDECHGIQENELKAANYFKLTKRSLTYKVVLSGIFLALSVAVSALDILLETVQIPIGQVYISFRFLDTIVLLLGLPVLGPAFASLIGFVEPIFHNLIHGMEHGWIQPLLDAVTNPIILFISWALFYLVFRNSPYHHDPNKKKDWFKRVVPSLILVLIAAIIAALAFVLALYIQDKVSGTNWAPHPDDDMSSISWINLNSTFAKFFFAIIGVNFLKYFIAYTCFVLFEGKMRPINHRYR